MTSYLVKDSDLKEFEEKLFKGFCKELEKYNCLRDATTAYLIGSINDIDERYKKQFFNNIWDLIQTNIKFASLNN